MARDSDWFGGAWRALVIARLESGSGYLAQHLRRLKELTDDPGVVEALRTAQQRREHRP